MNRKNTIIIVSVLIIALIALIVGVVIYDSTMDTCVLKINEVKYELEDYEKFLRMAVYEKEDGITEEEKENFDIDTLKKDAYETYITINEYFQLASEKGKYVTDEMKKQLDEIYESEEVNRERLTELGISKEDYIYVYGKVMVAQEFSENIENYYDLPEGGLDSYIEQYPDVTKTYVYRIMQFDTQGQAEGVTEEQVKAKADEAYNKVKEGADFEEVAREYASYRINSKYQLLIGEQESSLAVFLSEDITDVNLCNAVAEIKNEGEYTEIIKGEIGYAFARVDEIKNELTEEGRAKLDKELTKSYASELIGGTTQIIRNQMIARRAQCPTPNLNISTDKNTTDENVTDTEGIDNAANAQETSEQ